MLDGLNEIQVKLANPAGLFAESPVNKIRSGFKAATSPAKTFQSDLPGRVQVGEQNDAHGPDHLICRHFALRTSATSAR